MNQRELGLAQQLQAALNTRTQLRKQEKALSGMGQPNQAPGGGSYITGNDGQADANQAPYTLPPTIENPCSLNPSPCPPNGLRDAMAKFLPPELMPANVGRLSDTAWFFMLPVNFAFGLNPTLSSASLQTVNVQIPKDGGFLLLNTSVAADDFSPAGLGGPYQVLIQDNQSAQQFMNFPVPLQMLAYKSYRRRMVTPMYFAPSATIGITLSTWLAQGLSVPTSGSGNIQILLQGLLTYVTGDQDVFSNVYSGGQGS